MSRKFKLALIAIFAGVTLLISPQFGTSWLNPFSQFSDVNAHIFYELRVPRVLFAFICGAALALSGMAFQAMFRNPLATPFTLGVSSGAALGSALYIRFGFSFIFLGISGITFFAFAGALLSLIIVYLLPKMRGGFSTSTLLLAGIAINFFCSSFILFIQYIAGFNESFGIVRWMMGALDIAGYSKILQILPFFLAGIAILIPHAQDLNILLTGEELAKSRGVAVTRTKKLLFLAASLLGSVVAFCGEIGFVE